MTAYLTGDPAVPVTTQVDTVTATVASRRAGSPWPWRLLRLVSVAVAIGLWQVLTAGKVRLLLRFDTLPTVTEIVHALGRRLGTSEYWLDLAQSLIRILTGFGLAAVVGVATGVLAGTALSGGARGVTAAPSTVTPPISMRPVSYWRRFGFSRNGRSSTGLPVVLT